MKVIFLFAIIAILFISIITTDASAKIQDKKEILIASWNMLNLGETRSKVDSNLAATAEILIGSNYPSVGKNYDVIFVQELRSRGIGFDKLCHDYLIELGYQCQRTEQISGKGSNNESYGVIYKNGIDVLVEDTRDSTTLPFIQQGNFTSKNQMVRPPMKATVTIDNEFSFVVYNNHIVPGDPETLKELVLLEGLIDYKSGDISSGNIVVLGDLNADSGKVAHPDTSKCSSNYLEGGFEKHSTLFNEPHWERIFLIDNYTNFAKPCSYDKIIPNDNMAHSFTEEHGIIDKTPTGVSFGKYPSPGYKVGDKHISDHKLIWAQFSLGGIETTYSNGVPRDVFFINPPVCTETYEIIVRGEGFAPDKSVNVYVTNFATNQNNDGNYKEDSYPLSDIRGDPTLITTDDDGNIPTTSIWPSLEAPDENQHYNVIVDVNQDQKFTYSIDVIDAYDTAGFVILECSEDEDQGSTGGSDESSDDDSPDDTIDVSDIGTAIGAGSAPVVLGLAAKYWPAIQSNYRKQKFEKLIFRELSEIGPYPEIPEEGTPWTNHIQKRFLHKEIIENTTENRDFILSLDHDLLYLITQLWYAKDQNPGNLTQWLYTIEELSKLDKSGQMTEKQIYKKWKRFEGLDDE